MHLHGILRRQQGNRTVGLQVYIAAALDVTALHGQRRILSSARSANAHAAARGDLGARHPHAVFRRLALALRAAHRDRGARAAARLRISLCGIGRVFARQPHRPPGEQLEAHVRCLAGRMLHLPGSLYRRDHRSRHRHGETRLLELRLLRTVADLLGCEDIHLLRLNIDVALRRQEMAANLPVMIARGNSDVAVRRADNRRGRTSSSIPVVLAMLLGPDRESDAARAKKARLSLVAVVPLGRRIDRRFDIHIVQRDQRRAVRRYDVASLHIDIVACLQMDRVARERRASIHRFRQGIARRNSL